MENLNIIKTSLGNISFTPDIPSSALSPTEYNSGYNIESDTRGIRSCMGDEYILSAIPGNVIYSTGGFLSSEVFSFICATSQGQWYHMTDAGISNITPSFGSFGTYDNSTVITATWNGNIVFFNDMINPPMYYMDGYPTLALYDNVDPVSGQTFVWNYDVTTDVNGNIIPLYTSLTAGFIRVYNSPNVGCILVAGNLTGVIAPNVVSYTPGTVITLPTTVRWSQAFGLNSGPQTWVPTLTNVANEVEIPCRGEVIDGFSLNGNFYVCSYWDTVIFSPIAYTSSSAPIFGISLVTQSRGLINENCCAIVDQFVYGVDARDIWVFNGGQFSAIGNQRIKNYFYANLNPAYTNQIFMVHNSEKYQVEIYYPDLTSTGNCNQMISFRYDLQIWNAPRQVTSATAGFESPVWSGSSFNLATRNVIYSSGAGGVQLIQKDVGTSFLGNPIASLFERQNISFGQDYSEQVMVHRVYPEIYGTTNAQITITVGGAQSVQQVPTFTTSESISVFTDSPWIQCDSNSYRITTIQMAASSNTDVWQCCALNWQMKIVSDSR